jgi:hypothetical protein
MKGSKEMAVEKEENASGEKMKTPQKLLWEYHFVAKFHQIVITELDLTGSNKL